MDPDKDASRVVFTEDAPAAVSTGASVSASMQSTTLIKSNEAVALHSPVCLALFL